VFYLNTVYINIVVLCSVYYGQHWAEKYHTLGIMSALITVRRRPAKSWLFRIH